MNQDLGYGKRLDGTNKGDGYFGRLKRPDGNISTEISADAEVDGRRILYPLLVPTLDKSEIDFLLRDGTDEKTLDRIHNKAIDHALKRIQAGKSPFAGPGEQVQGINR